MRTGIHRGGRGSVANPWGSLRELGRRLASTLARHRGGADAVDTAAATRPGEPTENRLAALMRVAARMLEQHGLVSMVLVGLDDLAEVDEVFGHAAATQVRNAALARLRVLAGEAGVVCRPAPTRFAVLVPGLPGERALLAANAVFGSGRCIEIEWHGQGILVTAACAARTLTAAAMLEEMHEELCEEIALPLSHQPTLVEERTAPAERPAVAEPARRPLVMAAPAPVTYATTVPMRLT